MLFAILHEEAREEKRGGFLADRFPIIGVIPSCITLRWNNREVAARPKNRRHSMKTDKTAVTHKTTQTEADKPVEAETKQPAGEEPEKTTMQKLNEEFDKSLHSEDAPLGEKAPGTPFALVALSYLAILLLAIVIMWFLFSIF